MTFFLHSIAFSELWIIDGKYVLNLSKCGRFTFYVIAFSLDKVHLVFGMAEILRSEFFLDYGTFFRSLELIVF